jgi:hypothetical protein
MRRRQLVVVFLLAAVALGAVAIAYWPTPRRQALARVEALKGTYVEQPNEPGGSRRLNILMLTLRPVTEQDLAAVRDIRPLHRILLDGSPVTDAGLVPLGELRELEFLSLIGTQVTDAGLMHLRGLKSLKHLCLRRTGVTDAGLVHLRELTALTSLDVAETGVTDRGVEELHRALPDLKVYLHIAKDVD